MNEVINSVYTNIKNSGGLSSVNRLYKAVKAIDDTIKKKDIEEYLKGKKSYTLHKVTKKRFKRRMYLVAYPGHTICGDVAYLQQYTSSNDGVSFLLVLIDLFSRYLTIFPLKSLKAKEVVNHLDTFFKETIHKYEKIFTDEGQEFKSKEVKRIYKLHNVHWYTTHSREIKASMAERVIQTIKMRISKYITETNQERYIDKLQTIVETYNHTEHGGILNKKPVDIHLIHDKHTAMRLSQKLYKLHNNRKGSVGRVLSRGDNVRLSSTSSSQNKFHKQFYIQNTREIFVIDSVNEDHIPITYNIKDLEGEDIEGIFYREELIPVNNNGLYDIEVLKKRKKNKKVEYLIKYIHYSNSQPRWVSEKEINLLQ